MWLFLQNIRVVATGGLRDTQRVREMIQQVLTMHIERSLLNKIDQMLSFLIYGFLHTIIIVLMYFMMSLSLLKNQMLLFRSISYPVQSLINTLPSLPLSTLGLYLFVNEVTILLQRESLVVVYWDLYHAILCYEVGLLVELFEVGVFYYVLDLYAFLWVKLQASVEQVQWGLAHVGDELSFV